MRRTGHNTGQHNTVLLAGLLFWPSQVACSSASGTEKPSEDNNASDSESSASDTGESQESGSTSESTDRTDSDETLTEVPTDVPEMIEIPAGPYGMGCNVEWTTQNRCMDGQIPYHQIELDAYAMDTFEVTLGQYRECSDAKVCHPVSETCLPGAPDNAPIACISWSSAQKYCEFRGKRLPTEAEWEKAARGDTSNLYVWGNESPWCDYTMMAALAAVDKWEPWCNLGGPQPVGSRPRDRSPYGVYDMGGSMMEWVSDWYSETYYEKSPTKNPQGPDKPDGDSTARVLRGFSYRHSVNQLRVLETTYRAHSPDAEPSATTGFRCAKSL